MLAVIFNLPFLMEKHHFTSGDSGLMISLFFLAIMAPGFCLDKIVDELKERTKAYSLLSMAVGLALIWIAPIEWMIIPVSYTHLPDEQPHASLHNLPV